VRIGAESTTGPDVATVSRREPDEENELTEEDDFEEGGEEDCPTEDCFPEDRCQEEVESLSPGWSFRQGK
jgi:hypothetical protein